VKDLNIGEHWANYSYSYINTALGDAHKNEFTMWPSSYLLKPSNKDDVEPNVNDLRAQYTTKNLHRDVVKYYA
jgi:hypothetical protein